MKKFLAISLLLVGFFSNLQAEHIKGGEMSYRYLGPGPTVGTSIYQISLKLYIDCAASQPGQLDSDIPLTFFDKSNNAQSGASLVAPMVQEYFIQFDPNSNPCIGNPPTDVCYRVRIFSREVTLQNTVQGYVVAYQRCCRIDNIINLVSPSNSFGATYTCEIPGTGVYPDAFANTSPVFVANEVAAICANSAFTFSFAALQPDADDSIAYALCGAYRGATQTAPAPDDAARPPYNQLGYQAPYSGSFPLGGSANIDPLTGLISGVAPGTIGQYVITACAFEYRKGVLINIHRKDIHVAVSDCIPLKAFLKPDYAYCDDLLVAFRNESINPPGSVYIWSFGDNTKSDTTNDPQGRLSHQYADTGLYTVKLKVVLAGQCIDSTTTKARVYPGFYPGFISQGTCVLLPLQFSDTTKSRYGSPSKWRWNFGDQSTLADTSNSSTPSWKYSDVGLKTVELIVESSKGCVDTVISVIEVRDKPPINLPFKDTLICSIDTLQLRAIGNGAFSWAPNYNILNATSATPLVFPKQTTQYRVTLNENGCVNIDSIRVRVVDFVSLFAGADTTICTNDTIRLSPQSDGLHYTWSPNTRITDPDIKSPFVSPLTTTTYRVHATIGKCFRDDDITIRTVPYPASDAGPDTTICFEDTAYLHATIIGSSFTWSPVATLGNETTLNPFAFPRRSAIYTLSVFDDLGCPKPGISTVSITVRNKVLAFAGNDTSVVVGQPLRISGSGAEFFEWTPPNFLSNASAQNPIATLSENITYTMRAFTAEGCFALDTINIKVFKTSPEIFMPNAFRPGGRNGVLRPIPVGISKLDYFRVFNRWGQLVFQTATPGVGWDGTLGGKVQPSGTYAWMVQGTDFTGKVVTKSGTAILIR
ncbi:MAG: gliding motility-associated C-terminal domain-containing protein [Chitinophagaceae bacterium]|nr:gliding motility-associated C-terminal domain-containing protein [Chitinophagaceae bacterium]